MSTAMPSLDAVRDALAAFRAAVRQAAATPADLDARACAELHAEVIVLAERLTADRDTVLSMARSAGAGWRALEETSGVADSTLRDRLTRWEVAT